jgi:hypothetical protein
VHHALLLASKITELLEKAESVVKRRCSAFPLPERALGDAIRRIGLGWTVVRRAVPDLTSAAWNAQV